MYSLVVDSVTTWEDFVKIFLKKFYPIHKTALIRKNLMQFKQESNNSFWRYFERFKDLLTQCPHYGIEKWQQCQILYNGLDYQTETLLETMSQGGYLQKDENQGWDLFEDLAEKTIQWEPSSEKPRNSQSIGSKSGLLSIESFVVAEAKIVTLMRRIEALETKKLTIANWINPPQIHNLGCTYCQAPHHIFEECPVFQTHQAPPEHLNAAYTRSQNNPYSQTYNPGWRNHPNFFWSQNNTVRPNFSNNGHHQHQQQHYPPNQAPSSSFQNQPSERKLSELEKSMETFLKTHTTFRQNTGQMLNNHTHAISRLEVQISKLASSLSERTKGTLPSQPLANPKNSSQIFEAL